MSEFLLVIPEGWTQLDWPYITNNVPHMGMADVVNGAVSDIEARLKDGGVIAPESSLIEFKLIDDTFFLVRLG
jgi:hypothetical protein